MARPWSAARARPSPSPKATRPCPVRPNVSSQAPARSAIATSAFRAPAEPRDLLRPAPSPSEIDAREPGERHRLPEQSVRVGRFEREVRLGQPGGALHLELGVDGWYLEGIASPGVVAALEPGVGDPAGANHSAAAPIPPPAAPPRREAREARRRGRGSSPCGTRRARAAPPRSSARGPLERLRSGAGRGPAGGARGRHIESRGPGWRSVRASAPPRPSVRDRPPGRLARATGAGDPGADPARAAGPSRRDPPYSTSAGPPRARREQPDRRGALGGRPRPVSRAYLPRGASTDRQRV